MKNRLRAFSLDSARGLSQPALGRLIGKGGMMLVHANEASSEYLEDVHPLFLARDENSGPRNLVLDAGKMFDTAPMSVPAVTTNHLPKVHGIFLERWAAGELWDFLASDPFPSSEPAPLSLDYAEAHTLLHRHSGHYYQSSLLATDRCNLRCRMCMFHGHDPAYSYSAMRRTDRDLAELPDGLARAFMDQLSPGSSILFSGAGEPLMHARTLDWARHATERSLVPMLLTNGQLLDESTARQLVDMGAGQVIFSVDGHTEPLYSSARAGGSLARVVENIQTLRRIRDAGKNSLLITVNCILFPELAPEKEAILDFWKGRADRLTFMRERLDHFAAARTAPFVEPPGKPNCFSLLEGPLLLPGGRIAPCCQTAIGEWFEPSAWMRNIRNTGLDAAMREYRAMLLEPDSPLSRFCARCRFWENSYWSGNTSPYAETHIFTR